MPVAIDVHNKYAKLNGGSIWFQVVKKGSLYQDGDSGQLFEAFPINIFAMALGRTSRQVWLWDKEGRIPKPLFNMEGEKCKRWYSMAQVVNCNRIFRHRYLGHKVLQGRAPEFFADIRSIWYARGVIVSPDGLINGR